MATENTQSGNMYDQMRKELGSISRNMRMASTTLSRLSNDIAKSAIKIRKTIVTNIDENITKPTQNAANATQNLNDQTQDLNKNLKQNQNFFQRHKKGIIITTIALTGMGTATFLLYRKWKQLKAEVAKRMTSFVIEGFHDILERTKQAAIALGVAIASIKAVKLTTEMRKIEASVGASEEEIRKYSKIIAVGVSKDISEVLEVVKKGLSEGIQKKDIEDFATSSLKLSTAIGISADEATTFNQKLYELGISYKEVGDKMLVMRDIAGSSAPRLMELTNQARDLLMLSRNKSSTIDSIYALDAALTKAGIGGEKISSVVGNISDLLKGASNRENIEEYAKSIRALQKAGLQDFEIQDAIKTGDVSKVFKGMMKAAETYGESSFGAFAEIFGMSYENMKELVLFNKKSNGELLNDIDKYRATTTAALGRTNKAFDAQRNSAEELVNVIGNVGNYIATEWGRPLEKISRTLLKPIVSMFKTVEKVLININEATGGWGIFLLTMFSIRAFILRKLLGAFNKLRGSVSVTKYLTDQLARIPVVGERASKWFSRFIGMFSGLFGWIGKKILPLLNKIPFIGKIATKVWSIFSTLLTGGVMGALKSIFSLMLANPWITLITAAILIITNWKQVKQWFSDFFKWLGDYWSSGKLEDDVAYVMKNIATFVYDIMKSVGKAISSFFKHIGSNVWQFFKDTVGNMLKYFLGDKTYDRLVGWAEGVAKAIKNIFSSIGEAIKEWGTTHIKTLIQKLPKWLQKWLPDEVLVWAGVKAGPMNDTTNIRRDDRNAIATNAKPTYQVKKQTLNEFVAERERSRGFSVSTQTHQPTSTSFRPSSVELSGYSQQTAPTSVAAKTTPTSVVAKTQKTSKTIEPLVLETGDKAVLERIAHGEGTSDVKAKKAGLQSGYDVTFGYGKYLKPEKPISQMTIAELKDFQSKQSIATRGKTGDPQGRGTSAVGKYQVMAATLKDAQKELGFKDTDIYTPELQDKIGKHLLNRRGYSKWKKGEISDQQLQLNFAKEWASVADPRTEKGFYAGQRTPHTTTAHMQEALKLARQPETVKTPETVKPPTVEVKPKDQAQLAQLERIGNELSTLRQEQAQQHNEDLKATESLAKSSTHEKSPADKKMEILRQKDPLGNVREMNDVIYAYGI